jgi:Zn-dependent alcohol dehydrogenase
VEVGPNTEGWKAGDKVVLSFLPMCGRCKWCASGMQNLCDNGRDILAGTTRSVARSATDRQIMSVCDGDSHGQRPLASSAIAP